MPHGRKSSQRKSVRKERRLAASRTSRRVMMDIPSGTTPEEARLFLMAKLYELGRLSVGKAAELAGFSKAAFMEVLGKLRIAVMDYPPADLEQELEVK